jgi:hypothetical protein
MKQRYHGDTTGPRRVSALAGAAYDRPAMSDAQVDADAFKAFEAAGWEQ